MFLPKKDGQKKLCSVTMDHYGSVELAICPLVASPSKGFCWGLWTENPERTPVDNAHRLRPVAFWSGKQASRRFPSMDVLDGFRVVGCIG